MKAGRSSHWEMVALSILRILWFSAQELWDGIRKERIDFRKFIYPGTALAAALVLRLDSLIAWISGAEWLSLPFDVRRLVVYVSLAAGWIVWAVGRAVARAKLLARLRETFIYCKLEANRKLPALIEDKPIDGHVRSLKLFTQGVSRQKFLDHRENLEAMLNISIVKISNEDGDKGRINILYAMQALQREAIIENTRSFENGEIPIGISYEGPITVNLRDIAHLLIAGQTGGGKSNFEKVIATVLVENNPDADIYYLDFKGGMELADLTNRLGANHSNFHKYESSRACSDFLIEIGDKIDARLTAIAKLGVSNLDDFLNKRRYAETTSVDGAEATTQAQRSPSLKRTYIIIDEIAQLYARDASIPKEVVLQARAAVNRIARQGRAAGLHLIIATQKPDSQSFDQTVKSNLPAVVCFPMPSQAASVSALGTKRAFDLDPEIKGRAVWKYGPIVTEVQTYLFQ